MQGSPVHCVSPLIHDKPIQELESFRVHSDRRKEHINKLTTLTTPGHDRDSHERSVTRIKQWLKRNVFRVRSILVWRKIRVSSTSQHLDAPEVQSIATTRTNVPSSIAICSLVPTPVFSTTSAAVAQNASIQASVFLSGE